MPTQPYYSAAGVRLPSVTTVLKNCGWSSPGLMHWAHAQGAAGLSLYEKRDEAAGIGTLTHDRVEAAIHGREWVWPTDVTMDAREQVEVAYSGFARWMRDTRIRVVATEVAVVSETYQYGGCIDWMALDADGKLVLCDLKTSSGTYGDHIMQISAYVHAWEETTGMGVDGGVAILRIDKGSGGFAHKWLPPRAVAPAFTAFAHLRALHDLKRAVEALAK